MLADPAVQGGAHGGVECFRECALTAATIGFSGFILPARAIGIGLLAEWVGTDSEQSTDTVRIGPAVRLQPFPDAWLQPHAELAFGPAWFSTHAGSCSHRDHIFGQLAVGLELRVAATFFVGIAGTTTGSLTSGDCSEEASASGASAGDADGARFGGLLTLRFGPFEARPSKR